MRRWRSRKKNPAAKSATSRNLITLTAQGRASQTRPGKAVIAASLIARSAPSSASPAGPAGGFAGLAAFSDAHVLLLPVATREGPKWVTCPEALRRMGHQVRVELGDAVYLPNGGTQPLNLGWLLIECRNTLPDGTQWPALNRSIPDYITQHVVIVSDRLFSHIVNSNLEVRTSVSINSETGAAEEGALFSYEALPRATVLVWDVTCKNPKHFQVSGKPINAQINSAAIEQPDKVFEVVKTAHPYLEHLGIGGMGTRGMGRLRVLYADAQATGVGQPAGVQASTGGA